MKTIRYTAAQAMLAFLTQQYIVIDHEEFPIFAGAFAIFGHGNVAGLGEALHDNKATFPTYRAHNEQGMAHAAIAYAKANNRRRMMMCTSSIGPGATNMVTAAGLAHANRLPVLFVPGDNFANRKPDPVLQQIEHFSDPNISVNDCFKPVSRYFDRINRPEQLINSLPVAMQTLLDPVNCGPVTLAFPQDVQAEAFDYPVSLFTKRVHRIRQPLAELFEVEQAVSAIKKSQKPLIIAGGGVLYSGAAAALSEFAETHQIPVAETQAGKGCLSWQHPCALGGVGVTGSEAANKIAAEADLIIAIGTRLQDFTTSSRTLWNRDNTVLLQLNIGAFDANKHDAVSLVGDATQTLTQLHSALAQWSAPTTWLEKAQVLNIKWQQHYEDVTSDTEGLPSDAQVLGAVKRGSNAGDTIVCAAGGLPGELHKLWRAEGPGSYHVEYGFSCMGYEIAGGLGVKLAKPNNDVIVVVGDGSYMMLNAELATSVMLKQKIIVILLDNRGFGCIHRLQQGTGNAPFNNLLDDCEGAPELMQIDFAQHARSMGANAEHVHSLGELEAALTKAKSNTTSTLIAINTDPHISTVNGSWWDVAIPQTSKRKAVADAHENYTQQQVKQPY
ncbi:3D-(3,5/4)-trihydroxycyclohexane-1,2-dione acylhydrolase (decyclizing) [Alteromonas australica]|uniref:3D-(3,5/4)-trihydroxycyclohexane-1,2-dione hydrolase n=1 Tax=Alteromonas australica TaxID=589873 RepID=A0A075NYJ6_9ALTE|nr:3D-(3,5/4)-trihydroxycyclohexane-1,2-dione acylhydrolase (decyclizing) [Alteromonas australica]AIF99739.1 3D-(3,5/4)-trihydroxycyclohexane-1,2-dione hydrolase [Alteromonas australica]